MTAQALGTSTSTETARASLLAQLRAILPAPGAGTRIALAVARGEGGMRTAFFDTAEAAAAYALDNDARGVTVYLSTALFRAGADGTWGKRDRAHMAPTGRKALHLDIDVGPGKDYDTLSDALRALKEFTLACGLRVGQSVVCSGGGLHVYWALRDAVDGPQWDAMARTLGELAELRGLRVDRHCTTDAVRLLRPVCTSNRKRSTGATVVTALHELTRAELPHSAVAWPTVTADALEASLRAALEACDAPHAAGIGAEVLPGAIGAGGALNADLMARPARAETPENVAWVQRRLSVVPADCEYPDWRTAVWAVASTGWAGARALALAWSAGGAKFDAGAFDRVWGSYDSAAGGTTLGSLDHLARRYGFTDTVSTCVTGEQDGANPLPLGSEAWHAREFAGQWTGRLACVRSSARWMHWTGTRWATADRGEEVRAATEYVAGLMQGARDVEQQRGPHDLQAVARRKDALKMANRKPMLNMLDLARSDPRIAVADAGAFDADPWLLGVTNGVVDLKSGNLLAPDPRMLVSRQCGAALDRNATCPGWVRFLADIFNGDAEVVDYVQRLLGYCLTGDVGAELLHFMYGHGANGKSVMANVVGHVLGSYVYHAQWGLLVHDSRDTGKAPNPDVARMVGARVVYVNETEQGSRLSETTMKALVSTEPVTVRELYGSPFTFKPTAKLLVRGNHRPVVTGTDDGVWRRLRLLPFTRQFTEEERDDGLTDRLKAEADGILWWMLQGLELWKVRGLRPPRAIAAGSAEYRQSMDIVGGWLDELCALDPESVTPTGDAFRSYRHHCESAGLRVTSQNALTRELERRGVTVAQRTVHGLRARVYVGLRLDRDDPPARSV